MGLTHESEGKYRVNNMLTPWRIVREHVVVRHDRLLIYPISISARSLSQLLSLFLGAIALSATFPFPRRDRLHRLPSLSPFFALSSSARSLSQHTPFSLGTIALPATLPFSLSFRLALSFLGAIAFTDEGLKTRKMRGKKQFFEICT